MIIHFWREISKNTSALMFDHFDKNFHYTYSKYNPFGWKFTYLRNNFCIPNKIFTSDRTISHGLHPIFFSKNHRYVPTCTFLIKFVITPLLLRNEQFFRINKSVYIRTNFQGIETKILNDANFPPMLNLSHKSLSPHTHKIDYTKLFSHTFITLFNICI